MNNGNINNQNTPNTNNDSLRDIYNSLNTPQDNQVDNKDALNVINQYVKAPLSNNSVEQPKEKNKFINPEMIEQKKEQPVQTEKLQSNTNQGIQLNNVQNQMEKIIEQQSINNTQQPASNQQPIPAKQEVHQNPMPNQTIGQPQNISNPYQINNSETIGTIKKDTQKSPITMLILFLVLIGSIFFIPQVTPYFESLLNKLNISANEEIYEVKDQDSTKEDEEETKEDIKLVALEENSKVTYKNIELTGFKITTIESIDYLEYSLKNTSSETYDAKENKLYLDLYDEQNTFIRTILVEETSVPGNTTSTIKSIISSEIKSKIKKIQFLSRTINDYPTVSLVDNKLVCELGNKSVEYTFKNNKIVTITENYSYISSNEDELMNVYSENQSKINTINNYEGITGVILNIENGFKTQVTIDYETAIVDVSMYSSEYYQSDTTASQIKYELTAKGYTCK